MSDLMRREYTRVLAKHSLKRNVLDRPSSHRCTHIALERIPICAEIFGSIFVQGVGGIRFEEEELYSRNTS